MAARRSVSHRLPTHRRSHRAEITVVFIDLRGYTAFTEVAEPEEVMTVLREYHADMGRLIGFEGRLDAGRAARVK